MLKSANEYSSICLVDFGLATLVKTKSYLFYRCGTPGFVAPEILAIKKGEPYTEKCDMFSVGVIFFLLLTGESPFPSKDYKKVLKMNKIGLVDFKHK